MNSFKTNRYFKGNFFRCKKALDKAPNPKDIKLYERFNKLKDYNDIGTNLPLPPPGLLPPGLPEFIPNNNDINKYNYDDDNFSPSQLYFPHSSRMPPTDNISQQ